MEDSELLQKIRTSDTKEYGFNLLIRKYQQKIYWHIRRMVVDHQDADDLVQETFIKVYKNILSFREDSQLYTWIYRIATNVCLSFLKKKKRMFFIPLINLSDDLLTKLQESELVTGDIIQQKLYKATLRLPDKQRLVFNLKYFDNLKYEEMAEITGTSVGALKASYHHAVKKIEEFIAED